MTSVRIRRIVVRAGPEEAALACSVAEQASAILAGELASGKAVQGSHETVRVEAVGQLATDRLAEHIARQILQSLS